jgi:hypothetical protein
MKIEALRLLSRGVVVVLVGMLKGCNLDRASFHKNNIMKQKRIGACERVRRSLEQHTKGERSARLVARSSEGQGYGKAGGTLIRNLCQRVTFVCARIIFSLIFQIYSCNNEKYINTNMR